MKGLDALQVVWPKLHTVEKLASQWLQSWTLNYFWIDWIKWGHFYDRVACCIDHGFLHSCTMPIKVWDQDASSRCDFPSQKVFTFVGNWFLNGNISVYLIPLWVTESQPVCHGLPVSTVTIELVVCWHHTPISVVVTIWQHTIGLCRIISLTNFNAHFFIQ
jgi:hypothetical protein